jgi:chaperonin GroES
MFQPLKDRVVVKPDIVEEKTLDSGIILRKEDQEKPQTGTVLSIGSEVQDVKTGDRVIYAKLGGIKQTIDGEDVIIMKENLIMAVICES